MRKTQPQRKSKTKPAPVIEVEPGDKRAVGRPPMAFDPIIAQAFLTELAEGNKSMRSIIESRPGFYPSRDVFWKWLREEKDFAAQYQWAREMQQHAFADDGVYLTDAAKPETANVVRLQVEARRWSAERIAAKHYGPHLDHTHTALVQTSHVPLLEHLEPEERQHLRELMMAAMARANAAQTSERTGAPMIEAKAKTINPKAKMGRTAAKRAG